MSEDFYATLNTQLQDMRTRHLYKEERAMRSPQGSTVQLDRRVINMCANNYLGLAAHPQLVQAAQAALKRYGYGLSSVRFICGTQEIHRQLEQKIATLLQTEDAILYSSCFDANTGLFETLFDARDAIISDALNHASIIDGIRLCKAARHRYRNNDMQNLEDKLKASCDARFRIIATDGVFSMDGTLAQLEKICALARSYDALVMVDDSHAVGVLGEHGGGTVEHCGVSEQVDIITGTLGKALGGASGGYVAGRKAVVAMLRQKSRPYLFSNSLAPVIAATSLRALAFMAENPQLRQDLRANSNFFRHGLQKLGFTLIEGEHPIIPIMVFEAEIAQRMAQLLYAQGVYAVGFFYPVVPEGKARIRVQISAAHTQQELEQALSAFAHVGRELGVI